MASMEAAVDDIEEPPQEEEEGEQNVLSNASDTKRTTIVLSTEIAGEPDDSDGEADESQRPATEFPDTSAKSGTSAGEFATNTFSMHLMRQAQLCKLALQKKYKYLPESISKIAEAFEEMIFNPSSEADKKQQEPRLNFYPPFAVPEVTASYFSFFNILSVPFSCCANRTGTTKLKKLQNSTEYRLLPVFDSAMFTVTEALGSEVTPTDSLPRKTRLVTLAADYNRLLHMKDKLSYVTQFAYPALNLPPKLCRLLTENLFKTFQTGREKEEEVQYIFTDQVISDCLTEQLADLKLTEEKLADIGSKFRKNLLAAIQYILPLKLMQHLFREPGMIKKMQEILHYTFNHGFINLITHVTGQCLSRYITFHGMTFENRNNNPGLHGSLDLNDGEDYIVDTLFLFLMLTWQTAMGIWQQNLNNDNMSQLKKLLQAKRAKLVFCRDADSIADLLLDWVTDSGMLVKVFQQHLPDFVSQMQLSNYRQFILSRSNISCLASALIKDFVPIDFNESSPRLWGHCYLLQLSYYLYNHGDYMQIFFINDNGQPLTNEVLCHCNLCSPHRMPLHNPALHNEILAIDSFDFFVPAKDGKGGDRVTLSPGMWANKYLDHFFGKDFFPFEVCKYLDQPEKFTETKSACIITKPEILATLKEMKKQREKFLLEKGSGVYLDPETGDNLSDAKLLLQPAEATEPDFRKDTRKRLQEQKQP
ncbi:MAG: shutoff protein [psittacine adenovirus 7]|uniref:Shutoff protein n=1 Tax=psittacine adenovirus 7 TaxID=2848040 RepID=A0A6B9LRC2_9ADEN|nr:MAG: shutoff protein [psittacine adenovirus 7]QHB43551.1 MAG: shutoff protein [psittacine adenovirus 7]